VGRWVTKAQKPDATAVYEFSAGRTSNEEGIARWKAPDSSIKPISISAERHAKALAQAQLSQTHYEDVHMSTFTPESFVQHLTQAIEFGMVSNLQLIQVGQSVPGENEFLVLIKKV
jgi:hypothetical protein